MTDSRGITTAENDLDRGRDADENTRPGPIYDAAVRGVMEGDPAAACRLLDIPVIGEPEVLPTEFPAWSQAVDLLLRVGPNRLAHVEYARRGDRKLVTRMLGYRHLIMRDYPDDELAQYVVVLGKGRVTGHDDPRRGFWLDLKVLYLAEMDARRFLDGPSLAPLAALGRGSPQERARVCTEAIRLIRDQGGDRTEDLLKFASVLATITLDRTTIRKIVEEAGMTAESIAEVYRDTIWGHVLHDVGHEEGREKGREQMLVDLLVRRFGPDPAVPEIAARLAGWKSGAIDAASTAASLDEVAKAEPPS